MHCGVIGMGTATFLWPPSRWINAWIWYWQTIYKSMRLEDFASFEEWRKYLLTMLWVFNIGLHVNVWHKKHTLYNQLKTDRENWFEKEKKILHQKYNFHMQYMIMICSTLPCSNLQHVYPDTLTEWCTKNVYQPKTQRSWETFNPQSELKNQPCWLHTNGIEMKVVQTE